MTTMKITNLHSSWAHDDELYKIPSEITSSLMYTVYVLQIECIISYVKFHLDVCLQNTTKGACNKSK